MSPTSPPMTSNTDTALIDRLTPHFVNDLAVSHAISALRNAGEHQVARRLNEWLVANNELKREALEAIRARSALSDGDTVS